MWPKKAYSARLYVCGLGLCGALSRWASHCPRRPLDPAPTDYTRDLPIRDVPRIGGRAYSPAPIAWRSRWARVGGRNAAIDLVEKGGPQGALCRASGGVRDALPSVRWTGTEEWDYGPTGQWDRPGPLPRVPATDLFDGRGPSTRGSGGRGPYAFVGPDFGAGGPSCPSPGGAMKPMVFAADCRAPGRFQPIASWPQGGGFGAGLRSETSPGWCVYGYPKKPSGGGRRCALRHAELLGRKPATCFRARATLGPRRRMPTSLPETGRDLVVWQPEFTYHGLSATRA